MRVTRRQLRKIIKEQLLNEALPGDTNVDAYISSVKRNPNNPEKWDKELIEGGLTDAQRQAIAKKLKEIGVGIDGIASFIGDVIMLPMRLKTEFTNDMYQAYAPDAESPDGSGNPISAEERKAAKARALKSGSKVAIEGILTAAGIGIGDKINKIRKSKKAEKVELNPKRKLKKPDYDPVADRYFKRSVVDGRGRRYRSRNSETLRHVQDELIDIKPAFERLVKYFDDEFKSGRGFPSRNQVKKRISKYGIGGKQSTDVVYDHIEELWQSGVKTEDQLDYVIYKLGPLADKRIKKQSKLAQKHKKEDDKFRELIRKTRERGY